MSSLELRLYNGDQARLVLENEAFQQAFADIEKDLTQSWQNLPSTEETKSARDRIHLSLTMLGKVKACLQTTMETGTLAKLELQHKRTLAERAKDVKSAIFSE